MPLKSGRKDLRALLWSYLGMGFVLFLMQILIKPLPATHPLFAFITLEDQDLPFFNVRNFHDSVYAWYALDPFIAREIAQGNPPLGDISPQQYAQLLLERPDRSLLPETAQAAALEMGGDPATYRIDINRAGFRGAEFPAKKPAHTVRIVAVGDSLTFGFGVAQEDSWVYHLQEELQKRIGSGRNVEVINAGVISFDSTLGVGMLQTKVLPLEPDWVLIGFGFNDYNFNSRTFLGLNPKEEAKTWEEMSAAKKGWKARLTYPLGQLRFFQVLRLGIRKVVQKAKAASTFPDDFAHIRSYLTGIRGRHATSPELYRANITAMLRELKERKIRGVLLDSNIPAPTYRDILLDLSREFQVPLLSFRDLLTQELRPLETEPRMEVPVLFRVELPRALAQRHPKVYVMGDYFSGVSIGIQELGDLGEEGDRVAGDQIYSGAIWIEYGSILSFRFAVLFDEARNDWEQEFHGWRIYRRFDVLGGFEQVGAEIPKIATPIYLFNDLTDRADQDFFLHPFMSETCHPNSRGHRVIGQAIATKLGPEIGRLGE